MQQVIRITLGLVVVCGLSAAYERLGNASEAAYRHTFDVSTYPQHPPGTQWKDLPYEYRKQYVLWFRDEVHRRFNRASVLNLLAMFAAVGMGGVLIWMVCDFMKQRLTAVSDTSTPFSKTRQSQQVPPCDTAEQF